MALSVVSHRQGDWLLKLLQGLKGCSGLGTVHVTANCPGSLPETPLPMPAIVHENKVPRGFGANHNQALRNAHEPYLCVINPDISLLQDPFPGLMDCLKRTGAGVVAPQVVSPGGRPEDNARAFPGVGDLVLKALRLSDGRVSLGTEPAQRVGWVAGMFMLFRREAFAAVGGFDEGFHLYYEDVDICARLWRLGHSVLVSPDVRVIHDARRESRRNPQYMVWHARSMARYFRKHWLRIPEQVP